MPVQNRLLIDSVIDGEGSVILFGAGGAGVAALNALEKKGREVLAFCDNDKEKQGRQVGGVVVKSPDYILENPDSLVLITTDNAQDIANQLVELGHKNYACFSIGFDLDRWSGHFRNDVLEGNQKEFNSIHDLLADEESQAVYRSVVEFRQTLDPVRLRLSKYPQYFHPDVKPQVNDVIVDGGAWVGDSAYTFASHVGAAGKIFSFEPGSLSFDRMSEMVSREGLTDIVVPLNSGLWSASGKQSLNSDITYDSGFYIDESGSEAIDVQGLDEFFGSLNLVPSLIKMDIEGSEIEAIMGAESVLRNHAPRLQISLYHTPQHLWEIPLLLKDLQPNYEFFVGHHSQHLFETVLYARCDKK